ncbi:hypothetical protein DFJ74DRAFT_2189 [Hyaloraphidium curvatum]|nr:hypothetical protein DFJ74DRAFT_2189 [Hyaloraphidium curvatum]
MDPRIEGYPPRTGWTRAGRQARCALRVSSHVLGRYAIMVFGFVLIVRWRFESRAGCIASAVHTALEHKQADDRIWHPTARKLAAHRAGENSGQLGVRKQGESRGRGGWNVGWTGWGKGSLARDRAGVARAEPRASGERRALHSNVHFAFLVRRRLPCRSPFGLRKS